MSAPFQRIAPVQRPFFDPVGHPYVIPTCRIQRSAAGRARLGCPEIRHSTTGEVEAMYDDAELSAHDIQR